MKKGFYAILAALAVFAFVMTGCDDGGGGGGGGTKTTRPTLSRIDDKTISTTATATEAQLSVAVSNSADIGVGNLKFQWYKSTVSASDAGEKFGEEKTGYNTGRYCAPTLGTVGNAWYYVVVTNSTTKEEATSNHAKVTIFAAAVGTPVEKIVSQNSAVPLWEFTIGDGDSWADYEDYTVEYYVKKSSQVYTNAQIRTRLYGAYLLGDLDVPDQDQTQNWGANGGAGAFRMINWNAGTFRNKKNTDNTNDTPGDREINNNNDFIIDNTGGTAASFGSIFSTAGGAPSKWFKASYKTDGSTSNLAKDYAIITKVDADESPTIFVGAGIITTGGNSTDILEYYVKNPTLVHKTNQSKNIVGKSVANGTTEKLFAGNGGAARNNTNRTVLDANDDSYLDVGGEITITFVLNGGTGTFDPIKILEGGSLGDDFPTAVPTRPNFRFTGWFKAGETTAITKDTIFDDDTAVTAHWESTALRKDHPYPSATTDTDKPLGAFTKTGANQPGWESSPSTGTGSFTINEFVWATKLVFTLNGAFTGGCRLSWGSEIAGWGSHNDYITENNGSPKTGIMTLALDDETNPTTWTYTVDLTKFAAYDEMIYSQSYGQLVFQYWGDSNHSFTNLTISDAKLIIPAKP